MKKQQIWSNQEDQMLMDLYSVAGCFQRWKFISGKFKEKGILKTQFQCRDRYINHLDPDLKVGKLAKSEIAKLFDYYDEYGPRWSFFQTKIKGRSQTMLKNQFYSTLRSLLRLLIKVGQKKNLYDWKIESANYSSKLLTDLYQGRKGFFKHKNFFRNCLKNIGCSVEKQLLQNYLKIVDTDQLQSFYKMINDQIHKNQGNKVSEKRLELKQEKKQKKITGEPNESGQKIEEKKENPQKDNNVQVTVTLEDNEIVNNNLELNTCPLMPLTYHYNMLGPQYVYSLYFYQY